MLVRKAVTDLRTRFYVELTLDWQFYLCLFPVLKSASVF